MRLSVVELEGEGKIWELWGYVSDLLKIAAGSRTEDDFAVDTIFRRKSLFSAQNKNWSYLYEAGASAVDWKR